MKLSHGIFASVLACSGIWAVHWKILNRFSESVKKGFSNVIAGQSNGLLKLRIEKSQGVGFSGVRLSNFVLSTSSKNQEITIFSEFNIHIGFFSLFTKTPTFEFDAVGKSGRLKGRLTIDKDALMKGALHQISSQYEMQKFNLGPIMSHLLAKYFEEGSLLRTADHPDAYQNERIPIERMSIPEFVATGSLSYTGGPFVRGEFGQVSLDTKVEKVRIDVERGKGSSSYLFGPFRWELKTKNRVMKSPDALILKNKDVTIQVKPTIEVSAGAPQIWSTTLGLNFTPHSAAGMNLAQTIAEDWRCGVRLTKPVKTLGLFAFFQVGRLGCVEIKK